MIQYPAYLGFSIDSAIFECVGQNGGAPFNSATPICEQQVGANGELEIKVSNLKTGNYQNYPFQIVGLINGPSAVSNTIDTDIGQDADIACISFDSSGTEADRAYVFESTINLQPYERTSGFTLTTSPNVNNVLADLTVTVVLNEPIPPTGSLSVGFPYVNQDYEGLGPIILKSYIEDQNGLSATGSYNDGTRNNLSQLTAEYREGAVLNWIDVFMANTAEIPANSVLSIVISEIRTPPSTHQQTGFTIRTGD